MLAENHNCASRAIYDCPTHSHKNAYLKKILKYNKNRKKSLISISLFRYKKIRKTTSDRKTVFINIFYNTGEI